MIVIFHSLSRVQSITLDFCYSAASTVDESATVVRTLAWINLKSADCTGLVARVIFVMIVILKGFPLRRMRVKKFLFALCGITKLVRVYLSEVILPIVTIRSPLPMT